MKKQWTIDELEAHFTLLLPELEWLDSKATDKTHLGQAIMTWPCMTRLLNTRLIELSEQKRYSFKGLIE